MRPASLYAAAVISASLAILLLGSNVLIWFWPYNRSGLWNEAARLAMSLPLGAILLLALPRRYRATGGRAGRFACFTVIASLIYSFAAATDLGWSRQRGFGFAANRFYLFSTRACDFLAGFPAPPQFMRLDPEALSGAAANQPIAVLADLESLTSFRADCAPVGDGHLRLAADSLEQFAGQAMQRWAAASGVHVTQQSFDRDQPAPVLKLEGWLGGSVLPDEGGAARRTLIASWSYVGKASVMTVTVAEPGAATLSPGARQFLAGVRPKT